MNKDLEKIIEHDLDKLIKNSVAEGRDIEYKEILPGHKDLEKKEFLADISSFANTIGGDLIYGIKEKNGIAKDIAGSEVDNTDEEIRRLDSIIRDGIEPRIQSAMRFVKLKNNKFVLIIRIKKSCFGPHRVIYKGHDKFYGRNSAGKYSLDTMQLHSAFNFLDTAIDKVRKFKLDRIIKLNSNETPILFGKGAKIVLHLIPLESFDPNINYNINSITDLPGKLQPICSSGWNHRTNLEGFLTYSFDSDNTSWSYTWLYRNGIIEVVDGLILSGESLIPSLLFEKELLKFLPKYLNIQKELNVGLPIFVFLSLVGIKGYKLSLDHRVYLEDSHEIDLNILELPEALIESYNIEEVEILRPMFDLIWNACGFARSYDFDKDGKWNPK